VLLDTIICLSSLTTLLCHVWSLQKHFDTDMRRMPTGMNRLSVFVAIITLLFIYLTFHGVQPLAAQVTGLVLVVASFEFFWAAKWESSRAKLLAAFDEKLPSSLLTTGPYSLVRHPFYTSYLLLWAGWAIATWSIWALPPLAAIIIIYWTAASDEERKFAATPMAEEYAAYAARTGRFFPKFGTVGAARFFAKLGADRTD
jgi:protein-S-isoprenylcysteine O-methyltransferase Ste14